MGLATIAQLKEETDVPEISKATAGDGWNICLLVILRTLQMIIVKLGGALPLILQGRGITTYAQQAELRLMFSPYAFKLLYAPLVDFLYIPKIGKRKSWIIPSLFIMGMLLFIISMHVEDWMSIAEDGPNQLNITALAYMFFFCVLLSTTQGIATGAWALTLLKKENLGYAATAMSIGVNLSNLLGFVFFILSTSEDFCNSWLRTIPQAGGIFSISSYLAFWSILMMLVATLVLLFKKEEDIHGRVTAEDEARQASMTIVDSYKVIYQILKLMPVKILLFILLTCKVTLWTKDLYTLKLIESGVSTDQLVILSIPLVLFQNILPIISKHYFTGPKCLISFIYSYQFRCFYAIALAVMIYFVPEIMQDGKLTMVFYIGYFIANSIEHFSVFVMGISESAFFSRVSDLRFGGTYLTLVQTARNLGSKWPRALALWLVEYLTWQICTKPGNFTVTHDRPNSTFTQITMPPKSFHRECTGIDGYYVETAIAVVYGLLWLHCGGKKLVQKVQQFESSEWLVKMEKEKFVDQATTSTA